MRARWFIAVVVTLVAAGCSSHGKAQTAATTTSTASTTTTLATTTTTTAPSTTLESTTLPDSTTASTEPPPPHTDPTVATDDTEGDLGPDDPPEFDINTCGDNQGPADYGMFTGMFRNCGKSFTVRATCNAGEVDVFIDDPGGDEPDGWLSIGMLVDDESNEVYKPAPRQAGDVLTAQVQRNVTIWGTGKSTRPARVEYDCRNN